MNHLEYIVKDGTVKIPSIFMFDDILELESFLNHAKKMNCTIVFVNEEFELPPHWENMDVRFLYYNYRSLVSSPNLRNSYLRYLGNIDKMNWDNIN